MTIEEFAEGKMENGVFSVTPTHLGYKNKISFLEE